MSKKFTIDSEFVGVPWKQVTKRITWRDTTNYAAGLQDMNPLYIDDEREDGIIAPPMFAVTLGWPLTNHIHEYVDVPYTRALLDRDVHYSERIEFFKPIKPGEDGVNVIIKPSIHAMIPHRAGTHLVYKYEVTDENGELYHIEYDGVMLRGVECIDGGKGERPSVPETTNKDNPLWESPIFVSRAQSYIYDACSNIIYGVHTSPKFAHNQDLPDIIIVGTSSIAYAFREVVNKELNGDPTKIKVLNAQLSNMVLPDTTIRVQLMERRPGNGFEELFFRVLNEEGKVAVSRGYLKVLA